jgi:hypothetical protein
MQNIIQTWDNTNFKRLVFKDTHLRKAHKTKSNPANTPTDSANVTLSKVSAILERRQGYSSELPQDET